MQVTETSSEDLKREFKVVVSAADLAAKADSRLAVLKDQVRINGFRPGKVPVSHLKRLYGRAAMAEAIEGAVREANAKIVTDHNLRLARDPSVTMPTEKDAVESSRCGQDVRPEDEHVLPYGLSRLDHDRRLAGRIDPEPDADLMSMSHGRSATYGFCQQSA